MTRTTLDKYDAAIVRELIIDPKLSDNQISKRSKIPVKTVNRKRKLLEQNGLINYYVSVNNGPKGTSELNASVMYLISFKFGIFRKQFLDIYQSALPLARYSKHIDFKLLGESDGHLMLVIYIKSRTHEDLIEIFNADIVDKLRKHLGADCIDSVKSIPISSELSVHHNYDPIVNMRKGKIDPDWSKELIFVNDK